MIDYREKGLAALIVGEPVELQVFVAVLPCAGYTFEYVTSHKLKKLASFNQGKNEEAARSLRECLIKEETVVAAFNLLLPREPQGAEKTSL